MADDKPLPIPLEIPWQLASTTQPLGPDKLLPDATTISLFTYSPTLESLDKDYPDERLVYLKFIASISPHVGFLALPTVADSAFAELSNPRPIWYVILDLTVTPPIPFDEGGSRPYFLAASPIRRTMLETGVVGDHAFEGASSGLAVGTSGSQLHESSRTSTGTSAWNVFGSVSPFSESGTATTTSSDRNVVQHVDTMTREASQERRELLSHTTNVNNVLSLLTAKFIGTPYLRFALWPPPLRPLTLDQSDRTLWYAELLKRRSSGIEGIQEFYAVAAIPKALKGFCIHAALTRVSVFDSLPTVPDDLEYPDRITSVNHAHITQYLHKRYPRGTPLEELDVANLEKEDLTNPLKEDQLRPVVFYWYPVTDLRDGIGYGGDTLVYLRYRYGQKIPDKPGRQIVGSMVYYKTGAEVWLDLKREEYEDALAASPLNRGTVLALSTTLGTCFDVIDNRLSVKESTSTFTAPRSILFTAKTSGSPPTHSFRDRDAYRAAVLSWNGLQQQLGAQLSSTPELPTSDFRLDDPRFVAIYLRSASGLREDDPSNESLDDLLQWIHFTSEQVRLLRATNVKNLRELAEVVILAPGLERYRRAHEDASKPEEGPFQAFSRAGRAKDPTPPPPDQVPFELTAKGAAEMRRVLGEALQARYAPAPNAPQATSGAGAKQSLSQ